MKSEELKRRRTMIEKSMTTKDDFFEVYVMAVEFFGTYINVRLPK
jgi:hypothetical protein